MAHMKPFAEYFAAYHVETESGTEVVPESVCGKLGPEYFDDSPGARHTRHLAPYLEGSTIRSVERKEGWYGRLSAPGYLDCTSWDGPHETADAALDAVKGMFDVDDEGDDESEGEDRSSLYRPYEG